MCVHREFSYKSPGDRIVKIGQYLPKLLSNIKGYTFLGHSVIELCCELVKLCYINRRGLFVSHSATRCIINTISIVHLDMPRTAGSATARLHGNAAGKVTVSASYDVDGIPRRNDVMSVSCFHGTAPLTWLCNHCKQYAVI